MISLIFINENMKFSQEILSKVFKEPPMSHSLGKKNKLSSIILVENSFSSISPTIWSRVRLSQWWHFINFTMISLMFTHKYLPQKCHSFKLLDTSLSHRVHDQFCLEWHYKKALQNWHRVSMVKKSDFKHVCFIAWPKPLFGHLDIPCRGGHMTNCT